MKYVFALIGVTFVSSLSMAASVKCNLVEHKASLNSESPEDSLVTKTFNVGENGLIIGQKFGCSVSSSGKYFILNIGTLLTDSEYNTDLDVDLAEASGSIESSIHVKTYSDSTHVGCDCYLKK